MKKISKSVQRKLYKMFEEVVDRGSSDKIQVMLDFGNKVDFNKERERTDALKREFLKHLEAGIVN
ncbi:MULTISPECIES: hypothetical protein [Bacillus]|uniref:Uncharacterized protein n=2 Tax=Bacillus thuringiensis TaxID=1428 RepID=A0A9X6VCE4_BACTU|nr:MULTISPECIES: hypothetical protein [Bacillus]MEC0046390.1 hypothetical protein [Bacillus cereus]AFV21754.1 hypothetical protein BTB_502p04490 [Bacillus thuringiensis Bt407]ERI01070.1 hypothetical protein BTCBT_002625 [Bacillus thuringiensis T01-328]MBN6707828.1 hypothetical protein [Bacillus thuringiensis]MDN7078347.1 hypothetical protein [Bacillus thuringiensis]